ncbi:MAG: undecaprenyl-phosphate glucose phosphotransferase, partial [Rhizobiales bacterium]|nr:undecaprenyl-phosphate glucose phosphotransferase [Hyphomicrobiales bacterium]
MTEFQNRSTLQAGATAIPAGTRIMQTPRRAAKLSAAALKVIAQPFRAAYSPIVLAGLVRLIDFALIVLTGTAVYTAYVLPHHGFDGHYPVAIGVIAAISVLSFQAADIYEITAFRSPLRQLIRIVPAWTVTFFIAMAIAFFAKFEGMFSRIWLASYYGGGLVVLAIFRLGLSALVRQWT